MRESAESYAHGGNTVLHCTFKYSDRKWYERVKTSWTKSTHPPPTVTKYLGWCVLYTYYLIPCTITFIYLSAFVFSSCRLVRRSGLDKFLVMCTYDRIYGSPVKKKFWSRLTQGFLHLHKRPRVPFDWLITLEIPCYSRPLPITVYSEVILLHWIWGNLV